ncbi:Uncharacterised protein [Escherichia coli]|nr:Uncharacterised protein [Escherichia coli]
MKVGGLALAIDLNMSGALQMPVKMILLTVWMLG